jgi:trans-aconitate 2-methyltransferase
MAEQDHQGSIAGTHWNPVQYQKFSDHRLRPGLELLDRIPLHSPAVIYDLGCGAGELTRIISQRWPAATVYGIDNSKEMLEQAAKEPSSIKWQEADVSVWSPAEPPDLIYSNATLHWVDNHADLFPRLMRLIKPGGALAVQMPLSWDLPSHRLMRETLANGGPNAAQLGSAQLRNAVARKWVDEAEAYYQMLAAGSSSLDIWQTEYLQILTGSDPVLEWVKGTGLRPVLNGLEEPERAIFLQEYTRRLRETYPVGNDGRTLYPFRRLFIVAKV